MTTHYCYTESPLGRILLVGDFQGLSRLNIQEGPALIRNTLAQIFYKSIMNISLAIGNNLIASKP